MVAMHATEALPPGALVPALVGENMPGRAAVTSALGGSRTSPKSANGILETSLFVLLRSNAAQPPLVDCIAIVQAIPRSIASSRRVRYASSPMSDSSSAITTIAVSSISG